ncbi:MAG: fructose-bisphosphate aldolase [Actinobacteria bacterium]|nr:fructose-bisphosphate aldolase [Actinomycetota bacterium]
MLGKDIRMERIVDRNSGRTVIVPMDHGVTLGPIPGLADMRPTVSKIVNGGANAILMHKGMVGAGHRKAGRDVGLIVHLSASTVLSPYPNAKRLVCSVEEAIKLGADAVSIHVNLADEAEGDMLEQFGFVSEQCVNWGLPLVAMVYTRGKKVKSEYAVESVKHAARVGAELGADIVKVNYTGSTESFREVVNGCTVPVVIAGGEKVETDDELFTMVDGALKAGAAGASIGRNAFQHADPQRVVETIAKMVHESATVAQAKQFLADGVQS